MSHYRLNVHGTAAADDDYRVVDSDQGSPWDFPIPQVEGSESAEYQLLGATHRVQPSRPPTETPDSSHLTEIYRGSEGNARVEAVRRRLDETLEAWWAEGRVPSLGLLRDGLLVLEAGFSLDDAQRTLLLRAALLRRRGLSTALRHQPDPERTASVLLEAILLRPPLVSAEELKRLLQTDPHSADWGPILAHDLRIKMAISRDESAESRAALAVLTGQDDLPAVSADQITVTQDGEFRGWKWWRVLLLILIAAGVLSAVLWQQEGGGREDMVAVNAALSPLWTPDVQDAATKLPPFAIERFEVTNARYRRCVEAGVCPPPASLASATRADYFANPLYDDYPVVNVTWAAANAFCQWAGMRLPSPSEWEAAAAFAPATQRFYRYPWGNQFEAQFAVSAESGFVDTAPVGSRSPRGDSPSGAADMAGNVAEWADAPQAENVGTAPALGGSYADGAVGLAVAAVRTLDKGATAPWLGFRCAATAPE